MTLSEISSFPPVFLEKCLDITKELSLMKTGAAKLEVNLGFSKFSFSIDHSSDSQAGSSNLKKPWIQKKKKKSPSDLRRNALRLEKFLEDKKKLSQPEASTTAVSSPSTADVSSPSTEDISADLSVISETPLTLENEAMELETEISIPSIDKETVESPDPDCLDTRNSDESSDGESSDDESSENDETTEIAVDSHVEVNFLFCTADQSTAVKQSVNFPRSSFTFHRPHPRNKNHFMFSAFLDQNKLNLLKTQTASFKEINLVKIHVKSENKYYMPDKQHHCKECKHH